eukprot:CAMPEP_0198723986 /NCGR_PEP_ID=MMETSP1475-20131203/1497_1 /TAXON_ID= ORGANISM="Unidentified sp., Strain CCMP1999" /NCGR_SAMPLE_ID=MMETSP1475 /ASSEMBLY_ACC=CAM_ASM_001111 /LENGTH=155 /DNA_ID=CAMNT_0044485343 /DNA_START=384 /DNA_END=852 /DNA_ORIENTATION=+
MAPEVVSRLKPGTADRALLLLLDGRLFKCSCNVVSDLCLQHGATHVVPHLSDEAVGEKVPERRHVRYDTLHVSQPAMLAAVINERDAGLVRAPDHSPPTRSQARVENSLTADHASTLSNTADTLRFVNMLRGHSQGSFRMRQNSQSRSQIAKFTL